ncbi:MAG: hypothetical protein C0501_16065 [Isosphaera sp.]|nr:hypothetical protein [Isosphaera sp.]
MSRTLTLIDAGWEAVRTAAHRPDTLARTTRLLARPDLPAGVAAEAHALAGEVFLGADRFPEARRHLRAAAALRPDRARLFYLWGLALERDPHGCDRRAAVRFRKAAGLEPANHLYRAAFGRAAVRCGRAKAGVRALRAAAVAAPGDVAVVRVVAEGLLEAGRLAAARRVVTAARFLCPGSRDVAALWGRVRFETARQARRGRRGATRHRQDAEVATDGGRVVLPFARPDGGSKSAAGGAVRRDVVSFPRPHLARLRARKADRS